MGNHRRFGGAGRSAAPHHDEQVIEYHVHKPGEHLHARGEGDHALVADQRRAARDQHLERRAEGDDLQVADRLRKRFALASQHPAQLLGEQGIQRQNGDRGHHEHEQGDADDALRALRLALAAGDGADHAAAHTKARSRRQDKAHERVCHVNARKPGIADGMADEDAVDNAVDARHREREHGGQDVLQVLGDHRARDHAFPPVLGPRTGEPGRGRVPGDEHYRASLPRTKGMTRTAGLRRYRKRRRRPIRGDAFRLIFGGDDITGLWRPFGHEAC